MTARAEQVREALAWLERQGSKRVREEMATRYGIITSKAFGVPVGTIQQLGKRLGRDHELATVRAGDEPFLRALALIERGASDDRNFVKKGVSWALRVVGRRNQVLNDASVELALRLAESSEPAARWVGKDAFRELTGPVVRRRLAARRRTVRA